MDTVLREMATGRVHGDPGSKTRDEVESWLRSKQVAAFADASSKRDAREEETLAVAKDANLLASEANSFAREANTIARDEAAAAARSARWAKIAAIVAAVAAIASTITAIVIALLSKK
ncbi:MAG: hypothetical protein NT010_11715 [Proteobacteria bacterium]|nr:hypothetical protein [Pseudomonadota bacterium]